MSRKNPLILALDVPDLRTARKFVLMLKDYIDIFKVGSILFTREGPAAIKMIKKFGKKVFLDLKYHDIPNTVAMAVNSAFQLGVDMLTVHTAGGMYMMQEAVRSKMHGKPLIFGVTLLTSICRDTLKEDILVNVKPEEYVIHLAKLAKKSGLDGVISSGEEIESIRKVCGRNFLIITPGVRPASCEKDDQKRITIPSEALRKGADFIVVGRPILKAPDPVKVVESILKEIGKR